MREKRLPILYLFATLFLISGAAGLISEIVWERLLELYFGVTMISVTLIVSAYMAGLGVGSLIGGRIARHLKSTLFLYGLLEIGIALFGVVSPGIIVWIGEATAGSSYVLVFLISFAVLLIPTTLMGATLPLLTQSFVDRVEISGQVIGLLYGINTLGAAIGALLAGYVLVGFYGFEGTVYIAVFLNTVVGLCAFLLSRWQFAQAVEPEVPELTTGAVVVPWGYKTILLSSFLVGFLGLSFEMLWIRILLIVNKNTAYAFPSILFVFLFGLALGGYFWGRKADASSNPVALFCKIQLAGAAVAAFTFLLFGLSLQSNVPWIENFFETQKPVIPFIESNREFFFSKRALLASLWDYFLPIFGMVLPASLILGGGLPVLDRLSINNPLLSGRRVGDIHLANIIGSVAGSLAVSFVLLPAVGSEWTLKLLILFTFLFPTFYFLDKGNRSGKRFASRNDFALISIGLIALVGVFLLPGRGVFYQLLYAAGTAQETVISESGDSVLALTYEPETAGQAGVFWIGGEINSFFPPGGTYESRALACAGASQPKRILVIGFGGGYSTLFFKSIPGVEEIVVVELLGDIAPFLSHNVESTRIMLGDPRITYIVDDGRRYLNTFPNETFDLISIDPLRDHTAGHNNLYSEEALKIYRSHLTPGGVLCAWMDEFHSIPYTMAQVFPYVDQFQNEFMVAGNQSVVYHTDYMNDVAASYTQLTGEIYGPDGVVSLDTLSALDPFLRDQDQILRDEVGKKILRDMEPWLEYYLFVKPVKEKIRQSPDVVVNFENRIR
ncbi:MAG TPA: fused MFS/spermidine synthase [Anaerolineales bacterium]|nr:fused MFS/spermidine synthase [Anaerolineales bacterium]